MGIRSFFSRLFGFRWSLYICQHDKMVLYAMHEHSVLRILGYVMGYFARYGQPVEPWCLYINFNHNHKSIKLRPEHFKPNSENISSQLKQEIEAIDPGWRVSGGKPVFMEAATKKWLKISDYEPGKINNQTIFDDYDKPREVTFYSVMDEVFGQKS